MGLRLNVVLAEYSKGREIENNRSISLPYFVYLLSGTSKQRDTYGSYYAAEL